MFSKKRMTYDEEKVIKESNEYSNHINSMHSFCAVS